MAACRVRQRGTSGATTTLDDSFVFMQITPDHVLTVRSLVNAKEEASLSAEGSAK